MSRSPSNFVLFVRGAAADPRHARQLRKLGLRPTRKRPDILMGRYHHSARPQLLRHIAILKAMGLHGVATPERS